MWVLTRSAVMIGVCLFIIAHYNNNQNYKADLRRSEEHAAQILERVSEERFSKAEPAAIYLSFDDSMLDHSQMHHRIYFDLIGSTAYIKNFYDTTVIVAPKEDKMISNENVIIKRLVQGNYDYMYFATVSPLVQYQFGSWSTNDIIKAQTLYAIGEHEGSILLTEE